MVDPTPSSDAQQAAQQDLGRWQTEGLALPTQEGAGPFLERMSVMRLLFAASTYMSAKDPNGHSVDGSRQLEMARVSDRANLLPEIVARLADGTKAIGLYMQELNTPRHRWSEIVGSDSPAWLRELLDEVLPRKAPPRICAPRRKKRGSRYVSARRRRDMVEMAKHMQIMCELSHVHAGRRQ